MQRDMLTERHIPRVQCTIPIPAQEAFLTLARCCQVSCRKLLVINLQDTLHFIVYLQFWYFQQLLCNHAALTLYLFPLSHVRKVWSKISTKFQVLYSSYFSNDSSLFLQNFALSILLFTRSVSTGCKLLFQLPGPSQSLKTWQSLNPWRRTLGSSSPFLLVPKWRHILNSVSAAAEHRQAAGRTGRHYQL